jgi:hypothetical protein
MFHSFSIFRFVAIFTLFICLLTKNSYAQENLQDKQLIIEKNKLIELPKVTRNPLRLPKEDFKVPAKTADYDVTSSQMLLAPLTIQNASAIKLITEEKTTTIYQNYVKGGLGNYTTLFGEVFLQTPQHEDYSLSLFATHLSSANGSVANEKSGNSRTQIGLQGDYKLSERSKVLGKIQYNRIGTNYYGYADEVLRNFSQEQISQTYNNLNFLAAYHATPNEKINYQIQTQYNYFSTKTEANETTFRLDTKFNYTINKTSTVDISFDANFANRKDQSRIARNLVHLSPTYRLKADNFNLVLGTNLVYDGDTLSQNNKFRIYPHIEVHYNIATNHAIYTVFTGNTLQTSLQQFATENNFIGNNISLLHTNKQWEVILGLQGNLTSKIGYHLKGSYAQYKNLYFFNNSQADTAKFDVFYDTEGTKVFHIGTDIEAKLSEKLKVAWTMGFFAYNTESLANAWHRPNLVNSFIVSSQLIEKLQFRAELYNQIGLRGYNFIRQETYNLPVIFDLNLQGDYQITSSIIAFAKLNNIFSQPYQPFLYYQMQRFNALIGVMWRF